MLKPLLLVSRSSSIFMPAVRSISTAEARRVMQMPESGGTRLTEEELKKQYLKLAKIYHPDANRQDATTVRSQFSSF